MSRPDDLVNYGTGARLRAVVISISSAAAIASIVVGIPAMLVRFIGHPLPGGVPPWTVIRAHLEAGTIPAPAVISLLAMLAWLLWFSVTLPIVVELVSAIRGVATPRLAISFPGSGVLARRLVAGLFVISTSMSSIAAATPALAAAAVAPQELVADAFVPVVANDGYVDVLQAVQDAKTSVEIQRYEVGPGETLRSIAQQTLGDANRWKEIRSASVGVVQPDGSRLPEDIIRVTEGTILHLPVDAPTMSGERLPQTGTDADASRTVTVAKGNHFWGLAERTLADEWGRSPTDAEITPYWGELVAHNVDRLVEPNNPNLVFPEQQFVLPPVPSDSTIDDRPVDVDALRKVLAMLPAAESFDRVETNLGSPETPSALDNDDRTPVTAATPAVDVGNKMAPPVEMAIGSAAGGEDAAVASSIGGDAVGSLADDEDMASAASVADDESAASVASVAGGKGAAAAASGAGDEAASIAGDDDATTPTTPTRPTASVAGGEGVGPAASARAESNTQTAQAAAPTDGSIDLARWAMGGLGSGLMAAAIAQALSRRRRRQWQARSAGRMPEPLSVEAQVLDSSLRQAAEFDRLQSTEAAMRALSPLLPTDAPAITSIAVSADDVVLTLDRFCEPPGLFTSVEDSPLWKLQTNDEGTQAALAAAADNVAVLPALITLGHDTASERDILVDLEHVLALDVVGPEESSAQFVRTLAAELAASPFAEDVEVICCGFGHELCGLRRVVLVDSVEEACTEARRRQIPDGGTGESALARRLRDPGDSQTPVVLLAAQLVDDSERAQLNELSLHGVVVVAPGIDAKWSVALMPGGLRVEPLGLKLTRQDFTDDQFAALGELIEGSDVTAPEIIPEPLSNLLGSSSSAAPSAGDSGNEPSAVPVSESEVGEPDVCDIEVQVLGTVDIVGADRDFSSARAIDVISYLAFHRDGANADMLKTWIWPIDEPPSDKAFANVMSRARKGLGTDDSGQPYLARADSHGNYRLLPSVRSDVDRFEQLLSRAQTALDADNTSLAIGVFREALELVRGVPFTGGGAKGFLWADNGVRAQIEFSIDEAAHQCADIALAAGDLETARTAIFRGLNVIPWCEGCYRRRFQVAAAAGNRTELKSAMADLEAVLGADADEPEGSDLVSAETLALYAQLLRAQTGVGIESVASSAAGG